MIVTSLSSTGFRSTIPIADPPPRVTAAAAPATDSVALSKAATAPVEPAVASEPLRTEQKLVKALDGDGNGRVSKDEFRNSALDLLRRGRPARRRSAASIQRQEAQWARRLERSFARADANHDGSVDSDEMAAALATSWQRQPHSAPDGQLSTQIPIAEVAIRRYTESQQGAPVRGA
jgi:Ca2+-binding EF-hand superfamily protein